jgi:hypothetical protein
MGWLKPGATIRREQVLGRVPVLVACLWELNITLQDRKASLARCRGFEAALDMSYPVEDGTPLPP